MQNKLAISALTTLVLTGCGGGGGGSSSSSDFAYTGKQTGMELNRENSIKVANFLANQNDQFIGSALGVTTSEAPGILSPTQWVVESSFGLIANRSSNAIGVRVQDSVDCTSGGSIQLDLDVNEQSGVFSGSFNFNNCNEGGDVLDGDMDVSGEIDTATFEPVAMDILTKQLVFNNTLFFTGEISCLFGAVPAPWDPNTIWDYDPLDTWCIQNTRYKNGVNGKVFKYQDFEVTFLNGFYDSESYSVYLYGLDGRYYDPDLGFVDVDGNGYPGLLSYLVSDPSFPHEMVIYLSSGGAGEVVLEITPEQKGTRTYTLSIDTNGDSTPEQTSIETWE